MTRRRWLVLAAAAVAVAVIASSWWWRRGDDGGPPAGAGAAGVDEAAARDDVRDGPRRSVGARRPAVIRADGTVEVTGRVVDDSGAGAGIGGVDVVFSKRVDQAVTTDGRGGFTLSLPADTYEVHAVGDGVYAMPAQVDVGGTDEPLLIVVQRTSRGRGWVVDAAGAPVVGATVKANIGRGHQRAVDKAGVLPTVTTDANGVFEVDLLPGFNRLTADHPTAGHGRLDLRDVVAGGREEDLRIRVAPYATLTGVVRTPDGASLEGAEVTATIRANSLRRSVTASCDPDGRFVLRDLMPGEVTVDAVSAGFAPADPIKLALDATNPPEPVTLVLNVPRVLAGRLIDDAGEPVYDAKIKVHRVGSDRPFRAARTDVAGEFEVGGLDDGPHKITVEIGGRARLTRDLPDLPEQVELRLEP